MYSVLVSFGAALATALLLKGSGLVRSNWGLIVPALLAFIAAGVLLLRYFGSKLDPIAVQAQKHMQGGRKELALKTLREGFALGSWHPMVGPQLRVQTGLLQYAMGDLEAAEDDLKRAWRWPWQSRAYLACIYFRRREEASMRKAFEVAAGVGDKEGVLWTVYAYCLAQLDHKDEAIKVLERGLKKLPGDAKLRANIELLREGKKLKTQAYGDQFNVFLLEGEAAVLPRAARGYAVKPGFRQRPMKRARH